MLSLVQFFSFVLEHGDQMVSYDLRVEQKTTNAVRIKLNHSSYTLTVRKKTNQNFAS